MEEAFHDLSMMPCEPSNRRQSCTRCLRPVSVCWCSSLPSSPLSIKSSVYILQHPLEEKRNLRTGRILELSLPYGQCHVIKGRKFSVSRQPQLQQLFTESEKNRTLVFYPSKNSINLTTISPGSYNIIVIDGTWNQAKSMYSNSPELHELKTIHIESGSPSTYVIRTQPLEECLSTVESTALALAHVEGDNSLYDSLTKPLTALCNYQLKFGASKHHSKEYLVVNGMFDDPIPKYVKQKLKVQNTNTNDECEKLNLKSK